MELLVCMVNSVAVLRLKDLQASTQFEFLETGFQLLLVKGGTLKGPEFSCLALLAGCTRWLDPCSWILCSINARAAAVPMLLPPGCYRFHLFRIKSTSLMVLEWRAFTRLFSDKMRTSWNTIWQRDINVSPKLTEHKAHDVKQWISNRSGLVHCSIRWIELQMNCCILTDSIWRKSTGWWRGKTMTKSCELMRSLNTSTFVTLSYFTLKIGMRWSISQGLHVFSAYVAGGTHCKITKSCVTILR